MSRIMAIVPIRFDAIRKFSLRKYPILSRVTPHSESWPRHRRDSVSGGRPAPIDILRVTLLLFPPPGFVLTVRSAIGPHPRGACVSLLV
jgi:hypothetical protein